MIPLVQRLRLQAEDLHLLAPASETVKCLSLAADETGEWCFSLNDKGMEVGRQMGMKP